MGYFGLGRRVNMRVRIAAVAFTVTFIMLAASAANTGYSYAGLSTEIEGGAVPAGDTDVTSAAFKARKAVGLPAIAETRAVRAAARALLDRRSPEGAFRSAGRTGDLITTVGT